MVGSEENQFGLGTRLSFAFFARKWIWRATILIALAMAAITWQAARAQGPTGPRPNPLTPIPAGGNPNFAPVPGVDIAKPGPAAKIHGNPGRGRVLFAQNCTTCHGDLGVGGVLNPGSNDGTVPPLNPIDPGFLAETTSVNDPNFPSYYAGLIDLFVQHGSRPAGDNPQLSMIGWGDHKLHTQQELADIEAYVMQLNGIYWPDQYYPPAEVQMTGTHSGDVVLYTINIVNHGGSPLTTVMLRDTLPPGMSYAKSGLFGLDVEDKGQVVGTTVQWIAPDIPVGGTLGPFYIMAHYKSDPVPPNTAELVFSFNTYDNNVNSGATAVSDRVVATGPAVAQQPTTAPTAVAAAPTAPATTSTGAQSAGAVLSSPSNFADLIVQPFPSELSWTFDPITTTVRVGDKIIWTNTGSLVHSVTASDASFDSGLLNKGDTWSYTFTKPGIFPFYCTTHAWMHGAVSVQPQSSSTSAPAQPSQNPSPAPTTVAVALPTSVPPQTSAQVPAATTAPPVTKNLSPYDAIFVPDNTPQTIPGNGTLWYKFVYGGDNSPIFITLPNATKVRFKLYTLDQASQVYQNDVSIGAGTAVNVGCSDGSGGCQSPDLTWTGAFIIPGTYYIAVINDNSTPQTFKLVISGTAIDIHGK